MKISRKPIVHSELCSFILPDVPNSEMDWPCKLPEGVSHLVWSN